MPIVLVEDVGQQAWRPNNQGYVFRTLFEAQKPYIVCVL